MSKVKQETISQAANIIDPKERQKELLEAARQKDNKIVKGVFRNHEVPGGNAKFPFRKYKGDPIKTYEFQDGEIYEIPLCVAKHLNKNVNYPVHAFKQSKDGRPVMNVGERVQRYSFHSLDFIDTSDSDSLATMGPDMLAQVEIK